jgi:hypothetical protein
MAYRRLREAGADAFTAHSAVYDLLFATSLGTLTFVTSDRRPTRLAAAEVEVR